MNHLQVSGEHWDIGFQWGSLLAQRGILIWEHIPFPLTPERKAFAQRCRPIYQAYFPQVLEEIQGISQGQGCEPALLETLLFSLYALPPGSHCSCFAVASGRGILLGRNSDFLAARAEDCTNVIYRFPQGNGSLSFLGNTTSFIQMEDGVNQAGLAVGLTSVYPSSIQPGMNAGLLLRFLLETCRTTAEAVAWLKKLPIASAQTFTLADVHGDIAQVECDCTCVEVLTPTKGRPFVWETNVFQGPSLAGRNVPGVDTWQSEERSRTLERFLSSHPEGLTVAKAQGLLSGQRGFLCQYSPSTGKDTLWSTVYDLSNRQIFRAEGNPAQAPYKLDSRFPF